MKRLKIPEHKKRKSVVIWLLMFAGWFLYILFFAGLILGFLLGTAGKIPGLGDKTKFDGPADWVNYFKNEFSLKPTTHRYWSIFEARYKESTDYNGLFVVLFYPTLTFGVLIGGCLGALVPPSVATGVMVIVALATFSLGTAGTKTLYVVGGGKLVAGTGGMLAVMALISLFAI